MKRIYVQPQIMIRNTYIKNYIMNSTTKPTSVYTDEATWDLQRTKDRNDIWDSGDDGASIW